MVKRRKLLIGLGALAAGTTAGVGTGAFNSASLNNRDVTIDVVQDGGSTGLLEVTGGPGANAAYVHQTNSGIEIDISNMGGTGVNPDATFDIQDLFTVTNHGTMAVAVFVVDHTDGVDDASQSAVKYYNDTWGSMEGPGGSVRLDPGESVSISLELDTSGLEVGDSMRNRVSIVGTEDRLGQADPGPNGAGGT